MPSSPKRQAWANKQAILNALDAEPKPLKEIATLVGKSVKSVFNLLERMAKKGEVTRTERGMYARATAASGNGSAQGGNLESEWKVESEVESGVEMKWWDNG